MVLTNVSRCDIFISQQDTSRCDTSRNDIKQPVIESIKVLIHKLKGVHMANINEFIPMSETAYYILLSLLEEKHGYAIMQHVEEITAGRISLGAGTLYGTLSKIEKAGIVKITKEEAKRKYYMITDFGRELLEAELARINELSQNGRRAFGYEL